MLRFEGQYPAGHPRDYFGIYVRKLQNISYKPFHRKTYFT